MTRPHGSAVIVAGFLAVDAGIALACDAPIFAAVLGVMAAGALAVFWQAPHDDIDAAVETARATIPDHVPDAWTKEFRR